MNYYLEMAKATEQIKNQNLYDFINPAESRKVGTAVFKKSIDSLIKNEKLNKGEISILQKKIANSKVSNMKIQKHISLPAAVYFVRKKIKNISSGDLETIIRAQKDYFYKSFPKKSDPIDAVSKKLVQQLGSNKDITAKQISFAAYYRWGINKILSASTLDEAFSDFPQSLKEEANDLSEEQKKKYLSRLKTSLRPYQDNEIINKATSLFNIAGEKVDINARTLEEIKDIALNSIIDDEIIIRNIQSGTGELTKATIGSRKIIKKEQKVKDLKAQKDSGLITKDDLERMLKSIPGYNEIQKTKRDRVENVIDKISKKRNETIEQLLDLQRQRAKEIKEKGNNWKERVSKIDKQIKELSKSIGSSSSAELWSNLRKNVNAVVGDLLDEKPKQQIVNVVKKAMKGPKMSDNSMDFMKDLMGDSFSFKPKKGSRSLFEEAEDLNDDGQIDDYELSFYSFLNDLRKSRLPKGIVEPYSVPERHQDNCEKCQNLLYDYWVNNSLYNMKSEIKNEMIKKKYSEISKGIFQTIPDDNYLSDKQYSVLRGGKEVGRYEKEGDAKAFINSLIKKHIQEKPGIPQGLITKQYDIKKS